MLRWFAAIVLSLFLIGQGVAAFAGESGDPGRGNGGNSGVDTDHTGDAHSGR